MTETQETTTDAPAEPSRAAAKKRGGLNTMLLAELKSLAGGLGIKGASSMKKAQLLDAIKAHQAGQATDRKPEQKRTEPQPEEPKVEEKPREEKPREEKPRVDKPRVDKPRVDKPREEQPREDKPREEQPREDKPRDEQPREDKPRDEQPREDKPREEQPRQERQQRSQSQQRNQGQSRQGGNQGGQTSQGGQGGQQSQPERQERQSQQDRQSQQERQSQQDRQSRQNQQNNQDAQDALNDQDDEDGEGGRRNRRRRGRDRDRTRVGGRNEPDTTILEDDVLVPAAGILDVLDNYAFVRTSGYLAGADDVYLSLSMVRKFGLRRGDAIVGQVRQPREGERKEKFNPMVRVESVNGTDPEAAKHRPDFATLTPVHPDKRLRLETTPDNLVGRVIDVVTPVGKGQRGLILAPAQAGKTSILQSVATSVTSNNPECHLMVVLVDERPEEVTDFERSVKGEVIASPFDRAPGDHTTVAELAVERAKRLVELGHDVVVLVDGLTRLGRAYNVAAPASGRSLAGGVDASALTATKRFFGAARSLENGGSLTMLATALTGTGSAVDDLLVEELTGTESLVLRLDGPLAEQQVFPAVDLVQSGTRHEVELVGAPEHAVLDRLRRQLAAKDGVEGLLTRLRKTQTNYELLSAAQR